MTTTRIKFDLYPCQRAAVDHAVSWLQSAKHGDRKPYKGPTGIGKSVVELEVQRIMGVADTAIVTPRVEIIHGMMQKLGATGDAEALNLWTPIKLRNRLMSGDVRPPKYFVYDELHHHEADSWQHLDLLTGCVPSVGYTATYFRGTPKSTRAFHEHWGDPVTIATWQEAAALGYIRLPAFHMLPLVDDDLVEVVNGEFQVTSLEGETVDRMGDLVNQSRQWHDGHTWDQPTLYALPSTKLAAECAKQLSEAGMPAVTVTADRQDRQALFAACEAKLIALVHVNVISEGVDLKLRRLVDLKPTLSPVNWLQQLGRIMRPWDQTPEYWCTNRNVARHAYVLEGSVPSTVVSEQEKAFPPTTRSHVRVLGLESIGRFKPSTAPLINGAKVHVYSLFAVVGSAVVEWCCLVPPTGDPVWASKASATDRKETGDWGKWVRQMVAPAELHGFQSKTPGTLTEKQKAWWSRSARQFGLDGNTEVDGKAFQVLPVLKDLGLRLT